MCHWQLRVWQCGDSFFTKYSSCSFDRAAHDLNNLLNPLHPSVIPLGADKVAADTNEAPRGAKRSKKGASRGGSKASLKRKSKPIPSGPVVHGPKARPGVAVIKDTPATNTDMTTVSNGAKTEEVIPMLPLSEIGKASRFGDKTLGEGSKCSVFEVVFQSKEQTVCPACARSPKRARLPAHARGCFGLS
ncbi:uncharacterized protein K460DRAFT_370311 [Cucurbitaria berberidis CBS 394.84]|uniref:Uncharacterized protein n=1 Tax=Cucurbitaria berberidis CBS 394.84 TaxID=1168544 RepID=A0A9P4GBE1_9PLEO|nr:uncharacterized protein K460DRAFT_370311 [Cucurbitaria berberidis CBS 394.84]KAF1842337.1 hypothetical protein K460DRAFT_370311 [Cucurbitaria berberidis CBS 394.84]